jgi:hypothetical protein
MQTDLVENAHVPSSDTPLLQALLSLQTPLERHHALSIGVEGEDGQVYRVVRTTGLCETVRVFETARRLGFEIAEARQSANESFQKVLRRRA